MQILAKPTALKVDKITKRKINRLFFLKDESQPNHGQQDLPADSVTNHHILLHLKSIIPDNEDFCLLWMKQLINWVNYSGMEWTVKLLKNLKTDLQHTLNHPDDVRSWLTTPAAKNKKGYYKGIVGCIFRHANLGEQQYQEAYNLLMIYTALVSDEPLESQIDKFFEATEYPDLVEEDVYRTPIPSCVKLKSFTRNGHTMYATTEAFNTFYKDKPVGKVSVPMKDTFKLIKAAQKAVRFYGGPETLVYHDALTGFPLADIQQDGMIIPSFLEFMSTPEGRKLQEQPYFQYLLQEKFPEFKMILETFPKPEVIPKVGYNGEICLTQEAGLKGRFYLSPKLFIQCMLQGLKQSLASFAKRLPWDCTHNQRLYDPVIQKHLDNGGFGSCVDLSNASDKIPWSEQRAMLHTLFPDDEEIINLYDYFNSLPSYVDIPGVSRKETYWKRGQALGTGPSFSSFSLWHGLLLWSLCDYEYYEVFNGTNFNGKLPKFIVVGDDVYIFCKELAEKYKKKLVELQIDYSEAKTLEGRGIAEFTGYVFRPNCNKFQAKKMKHLDNDTKVAAAIAYGEHTVDIMFGNSVTPSNKQILKKYVSYERQRIGNQPITDLYELEEIFATERIEWLALEWPELLNPEPLKVDSGPMYRASRRCTSYLDFYLVDGKLPVSARDLDHKSRTPDGKISEGLIAHISAKQDVYIQEKQQKLELPHNCDGKHISAISLKGLQASVPLDKKLSKKEKEFLSKKRHTVSQLFQLVNKNYQRVLQCLDASFCSMTGLDNLIDGQHPEDMLNMVFIENSLELARNFITLGLPDEQTNLLKSGVSVLEQHLFTCLKKSYQTLDIIL